MASATQNAEVVHQLREHSKLDYGSKGNFEHAMKEMNFSARAYDRIL